VPKPSTAPMAGAAPRVVPWWNMAAFVLLSCGLAWLVALPLWSGGGLENPLAGLVLPAMMATPAVAALLMVFVVQRPRPVSIARFLGLAPIRPAKRFIGMLSIGFAVGIIVPVLAVVIAAVSGQLRLDLVGFSGFRATLEAQLGGNAVEELPVPIEVLVVVQLASIAVGAVGNSVLAFGEEVGWRGWLISALRPLGLWPTLLISGAVWGLWHAPLILLGYNFNEPNPFGLILMVVGCMSLGVIFGWLRLRSGNIWPAVLAHGTFNAAAGLALLLSAAEPSATPLVLSPLSWPGWIACALLIGLLFGTGQFRKVRVAGHVS